MDRTVLFESLGDEVSSAILSNTTEEAHSVAELAAVVDASPSTIYRRLQRLVEHDIVEEGLQLDLRGNHRRTYRAAIRHVEVDLVDGAIEVRVEPREDEVDRFTRIWEDIRSES